ncbi:MAG: transglutaminase domain-containing protein [Verrucomicrobiae bacterium]|nr:transglutaminase domain-containing protein [Verrucomicrobiae bacterium]
MHRLSAIILTGLFVVIGYWFSDTARARTISNIFDSLINGSAPTDQMAFERQSLSAVNARRAEIGLPALVSDSEIHDALGRFSLGHTRMAEIDLNPLFATLQKEFPSAQFLSATVLLDPREEGLWSSLAKWEDVINPQYSTLSTLAFRDGYRNGCLAILVRKLPEFDLEAANREGGRFFRRCPHCNSAHAIVLNQEAQTLILACPDCEKPYDVLAADIEGKFHRANDFLQGFQIPNAPSLPVGSSPTEKEKVLRTVWHEVLRHCAYEYDQAGQHQSEAWKLPSQTWHDAAGDCEDTSLLLADALHSVGIEARVAVGWNIHIGQHAWCVARIGDRQWILETTLSLKEGEAPELRTVADAAEEYQPEQLFDREQLYFRGDGKERAGCGDYWAASNWSGLPQQ